jgi:hypothetical protein
MILRLRNGHGLYSAGRSEPQRSVLSPSVAQFPNGLISLWSLPTAQRCKIASAGNGGFNTPRVYGQPSRVPVAQFQTLSQRHYKPGRRRKKVSPPPPKPRKIFNELQSKGLISSRQYFAQRWGLLQCSPGRPCPGVSHQAPLERWYFTCSPPSAAGMNCKTDKIRMARAAGDRIGALRVAARFFDRSDATKTTAGISKNRACIAGETV